MTGTDLLDVLQADLAAVLANCPELADAAVLTEDDGDMEKKILRALGPMNAGPDGKRGLALVVMAPEVSEASENLPGPVMELAAEIQVIEQPLVNRGTGGTGIRSADAALRCLTALHLRSLGHYALVAGRPPVAPLAVRPGYESHTVRVVARHVGLDAPAKPAGVAAAYDDQAGTITLSCETPGSEIYYTTDGTFPTPSNGTLYTAPIGSVSGVPAGALTVGGDLSVNGSPLAAAVLLPADIDLWTTSGDDAMPSVGDWIVLYQTDYTWHLDYYQDEQNIASYTANQITGNPDDVAEWTPSQGEASGNPVVSLAPHFATVGGTLTGNDLSPVSLPVLQSAGLYSSRPSYSHDGNLPGSHDIGDSYTTLYYDGGSWRLDHRVNGVFAGRWAALSGNYSPDLIPSGAWHLEDNPEAWQPLGTATGEPVVTLSIPSGTELPESGTVIRAAAYVAGAVPSDLTAITITEIPN